MSFRYGLQGLVVFRIEVKCCFCLELCLKAAIANKVIHALAFNSTYLWMQSSQEENALVVISDVSTLAGSDDIGAK